MLLSRTIQYGLRIPGAKETFLALPLIVSTSARANQAPESEIAEVLSTLDNLKTGLASGRLITHRDGIGPKNSSAQKALESGIRYFHRGEFMSAIREHNNFLNLSQVPVPLEYLTSLDQLAQSYEKVGRDRQAIASYMRYLATFATSEDQDFTQMTRVVKSLLKLAIHGSSDQIADIGTLLASLASLNLPSDVKPEILFLAGKTAIKSGRREMASAWLDRVNQEKSTPKLRSKALYYKALLAMTGADWGNAEALLQDAVSLYKSDDANDAEVKDLATIALARIAIHNRKPQTALAYFDKIEEDSESYRDALFESIYLHIAEKQYSDAQTKAARFIEKFPDSNEAVQIRSLLSFLDLKSGNVKAAKVGIEATAKSLTDLSAWMTRHIEGKSSFSYDEIRNLDQESRLSVLQSPVISRGLSLFSRLSQAKSELAEIRGNIRNIIFTVGRSTALTMRPEWINRAEQLARIADAGLQAGEKLVNAETQLYSSKLTPVQKQRLEASAVRRSLLSSANAKIRRERNRWVTLGTLLGLTQRIAGQYQKLLDAYADLNAAKFLASGHNQVDQKKPSGEIARLESRVDKLRNAVYRGIEVVRIQRIHEILVQSPHREKYRFTTQFAATIQDDSNSLAQLRANELGPSGKLLAADTTRAWEHWRFVMEEVFRQHSELESEVKEQLKVLLESLDAAEDRHNQLADNVDKLGNQLSERLGSAANLIMEHYKSSISARLSQQRKWAGDLEWMSYDDVEKSEATRANKRELERQILNDNLESLYQGARTSWPE